MKFFKYSFVIIILISVVDANTNSMFTVKKLIDIAPAWSGNPVRPALVTNAKKQFVAFYDASRQLTIAMRNINSTNWIFEKINEFVALDAHNYIAMAIDNNGFIHLAANMHVTPLKYWRTKKPYDISSFEKLDFMTGKNTAPNMQASS